MEYDSMVFYRSFYEAMRDLPRDVEIEVFHAICEYALNGNEDVELSAISKCVFTLIKPQIDANNRKKEIGRENGKKGAEYGKLGGRPKKDNPQETPKKPLNNPQETPTEPQNAETKPPNVNVNANVNVNENENEKGNANAKENENVNANDNDNALQGEVIGIPKREIINYQEIVDMYNNTCVSFPKVTRISEDRKKAIRARLKKYSLADLQDAFSKAESSDFLKGKNDRNWSPTFDWIMSEKNIAKVLDGNYDNRTPSRPSQDNDIVQSWMNA